MGYSHYCLKYHKPHDSPTLSILVDVSEEILVSCILRASHFMLICLADASNQPTFSFFRTVVSNIVLPQCIVVCRPVCSEMYPVFEKYVIHIHQRIIHIHQRICNRYKFPNDMVMGIDLIDMTIGAMENWKKTVEVPEPLVCV